jgi:hypothetical protein
MDPLNARLGRIERAILKTEKVLTAGSVAIPGAPGAARAGMGALQMVSGFFMTLAMLIPGIIGKIRKDKDGSTSYELLKFSAKHILHGASNIGMGVVQAIPVVGQLTSWMILSENNATISKLGKDSDWNKNRQFTKYDHIDNN